MNNNVLSLANLSDEELLQHVYVEAGERTALELELAARLEHLLDMDTRSLFCPGLNDED